MQSALPENEERKGSSFGRDDPPFTDSGYGSHAGTNLMGKVRNNREELDDMNSPLTLEEREECRGLYQEMNLGNFVSDRYDVCDSGQSVYSECSVVPAATKESYSELLAADLANKICRHLSDPEDLEMICSLLPRMLQEFALSFGGYRATQVHRDIMVFVHRYRRYVQPSVSRQCVLTITTGK